MTATGYPDLYMLIGGKRRFADDHATQPVINPSSGSALGQVPLAADQDIRDALEAVDTAFSSWRRSTPQERSGVLRRAAAYMREQADQLAVLISLELGKPTREALAEVDRAAELFDWAAGESLRTYGRVLPSRASGSRMMVLVEPVGPVVGFAGWNAPAITPSRKIAGAVAAGCSIILKPSEATPASALFIARALEEAGLPPGVLNVVFGDPAPVARALLSSPVPRMLTFTGSITVGKHLASLATNTMKRTVLELGGHAPVLVFDDVDIEKVARTAVVAKFRNSGQVCTSPARFYVQDSVYRRFAELFTEYTRRLKLGDPFDSRTDMGPLQNARRISAVEDLVADARDSGAVVRSGGHALTGPGFYYAPTVLTDVPLTCRVASEEPFGPIAQLSSFSSVEEGINLANRLPVGLSSYVFTNDTSRLHQAVDGIRAGTVSANNWVASFPETPFGGAGDSGLGLEGGSEGLLAFQQVKFVSESAVLA